MNVDSTLDPFLICRGMIGGMISVSISPSLYYPWIALINGIIAGGVYVVSLIISKSSDLDDTMHIS
jgi:ammonia channel protein AmtB